jgi:hypothetical protein
MYNAHDLYSQLMDTIQEKYPNFSTWRFVYSGSVGSGKSVVAASFPIPDDKIRYVMDGENSMQFIDAGIDGEDVYTPRKQRFRMKRVVYPTIRDYETLYNEIKGGESNIGVLTIDNVAIFQELLVDVCNKGASSPQLLRNLFKSLGAATSLPFDKMIRKWGENKTPDFWTAAKAIPKALIMEAMKQGIHIIATTEESNVWQNYGSSDARVIVKKAKIWDLWFRYFDAVIMLDRDVNTTNPPRGKMNPLQPKLHLQGFNPSWVMDWNGFIAELKTSLDREELEIPEHTKVKTQNVYEEEIA